MAVSVTRIRTVLSVEQVKEIFSSTLQPFSRKVEFGSVDESSNPFEEQVDFKAFASLKTLTGGWTVQIYIVDEQDARAVQLVAVGSSPLGRAVGGLKNTVSRAAGQEKANTVVERLRAADPSLRNADLPL
ncbi:hypothetical protein ACFO3J_20715 [Streptomyces polygonati]|uniref:Uncharacterized protein n=1 Tax=Streptomyces polygonati TaxID=1617087 RepID=A0ABV8HUB9_9ACTN